MIVKDTVEIGSKTFIHTYSDCGMKLERDGELYDDAYDLEELGRVYIETDEPIDGYTAEATEYDYQNALREMGVEA